MKLHSFEIGNYKSILKTERVVISDYNVVIGKNNTGKTNVLNMLNIGFTTIREYSSIYMENIEMRNLNEINYLYRYEKDYPLNLQDKSNRGYSNIILLFELSEDMKRKFKQELKLKNSGKIEIEIQYYHNNIEIKFLKIYGKGADNYNAKRGEIFAFIMDNFEFLYVPALRPEEDSLSIIHKLVNSELNELYRIEEYKKAMATIKEQEKRILSSIQDRIVPSLKNFLPELESARITISDNRYRGYFRREIGFYLDDGNLTELTSKGDGIKSLVSVALINSLSNIEKSRLIAIEEPESHLHPEAIHQLNKVLKEISNSSDVIISTHNPIFINSEKMQSNFIVNENELKSSKSIKEIRNVLGTKVSDSLFLSENIIIVEGNTDEQTLKLVLSKKSQLIKNAIENKNLSFYSLNGSSKLSSVIPLMQSFLINYTIVLDNDKAGIDALNNASSKNKINMNNVILYNSGSRGYSELEDLFNYNITDKLLDEYCIVNKNFDYNKLSWSQRLKEIFIKNGRLFTKDIENDFKQKIYDNLISSEECLLTEQGLNIINQIINIVEMQLRS